MPFKLESFGISDIGLIRSNNEDIWAAVPEKQFFILADGMGGHKAGEIASSFAVESMCKSMRTLQESQNSLEEVCQLLRGAVAKANAKVFDQSRSHPDLAGMGTTLSCFLVLENFLVYAHIGDSRLYRYRNKLEQLSEDHSLRQGLGNKEAEPSPALHMRNVITRAIGTHPSVLPDIGVIPLHSKDLYMLCSDGLTDYVEEGKIGRILSSALSLEEMGRKLIESALEKGGNDNITLLLVKIA
jgi:protein phosphatase